MIGVFPEPYPDELLYSVFSRYYVRSGYRNYVFVAEDLFLNRSVRPSFEYLPALKEDVVNKITSNASFEKIIPQHTMFPYHCRFLPKERKEQALQSLIEMDKNYHDHILFPKRKHTPTMRYCPLCVVQDRKNRGETYWHRIHQIQELTICTTHHCYLIKTDLTISGKTSPDLMPAEIVIPYNTETEFCEDEKMCSLVDYINDVFHLPAISEIESPISEVFNEKTSNTKYRSPRGQVCRITSLYNDFADFYKGLFVEIPEQWKVHKILTGQRFDFFEVVLLGFFLGIEPQDYQGETKSEKTQNEVFDIKIHLLHEDGFSYPQIANKMGLSLDTIKNAAYLSKRKTKPRKRRGGKPGRRQFDWQAMDRDMLPKVVATIDNLKASDKPHRITIGGVARLVGLKSKQIDKLPLCKAEIMRNCQSQEVFWAQKVLWAWSIISREGRSKSVKQVRLITNMSTDQIRRCMFDLEKINIEVFTEISKIIRNEDEK